MESVKLSGHSGTANGQRELTSDPTNGGYMSISLYGNSMSIACSQRKALNTKEGMLAILHCFSFENLMDVVISYRHCNSRYPDKCTSVAKLISLVNTSDFVFIKKYTKIPTLPTLCITGKLIMDYHNHWVH